MNIQFLDLHDLDEGDNNILTSIMNSNIEDIQLPWTTLNNNNSNNKYIAERNIQQSCSSGKYINISHYIII